MAIGLVPKKSCAGMLPGRGLNVKVPPSFMPTFISIKELPQMIDKTINSTQLISFSLTALNFGEVPYLEPKNSPFSNKL